jgi:hypothetical protein
LALEALDADGESGATDASADPVSEMDGVVINASGDINKDESSCEGTARSLLRGV